jgi:hypothetical protein
MNAAIIAVAVALLGQDRQHIAGEVVDAQSRPIAGAEVVLTAGPARDGSVPVLARTTTGPDGRFRLERPDAARSRDFLSPGVIWAYRPGQGLGVVDVIREDKPEQAHRIVLEPQEIRRLTIRDPGDKPVAGARVAARLVQTERTGYLGVTVPDEWLDRLAVASNAEGVAALPGLMRLIELRAVRVEVPGRGAHVATLRYADGKTDATIALGRPARLEGTIKDAAGRPVAGVPLEVWMRCGLPLEEGRSFFYVIPELVRTGGEPIRTDARGSFRVPGGLVVGATYRIVVRADGFAPALSDWITTRGERATLPPLTIRRLQTIAGRIADRQGKPVAGAKVVQPGGGPSTTTDEAGRFRLAGARPGRSFLLARREGFRFGGTLLDGRDDQPVELILTRPGEPPERMMRTLPGPIPEEESRALARRVLMPYLKRAVAEGDDPAKLWSLRNLRWIDPARLLDQVQRTRFERGTTADFLRGEAALGLAATDPEEAATIAETIADPSYRAGTLVDLADLTPASDRARKLTLLDRAALQARAGGLSSNKLFQMGEVAERWLELGETEKARALFAEGRKLVETEPPQSRTNAGSFLAHLARVEPDRPLGLIENVGPRRWRERIYGNIAIRLAFEHPAEAEALLNRLDEPIWRVYGAPRICRRLARNDPTRARRIADNLPYPAERAYAWTFLADGLVAGDRTAAAAALDRALQEVDSIDAGDLSRASEPNPAASILPLVEPIAPDRVAEVFWRALALSTPGDDPRIDFGRDDPLPSVAALLARYDREAAATLFEPVAAFVRSRALRDGNDIIPAVVVALTCLDPRGAVELVESLPPAKNLGVNEPSNLARITVAELLAKPPDRRWMGVWRFYSGCGSAMFEDVYREL